MKSITRNFFEDLGYSLLGAAIGIGIVAVVATSMGVDITQWMRNVKSC